MKCLVDMQSQPQKIAGIVVLVGLKRLRKPFTEEIGGTG